MFFMVRVIVWILRTATLPTPRTVKNRTVFILLSYLFWLIAALFT